MDISLLKALFNSISSFLSLYSDESIDSEPVMEYYRKTIEILKLLKPILECVVDLKVNSDELLNTECGKLCQLVDDLRGLFETWHPLMSSLCFVLQIESLISRTCTTSLEILVLLKSYHQSLPANFSVTSLEPCIDKLKVMVSEETSNVVNEVLREESEGAEPTPNKLIKIAESLNLRSNQGLLIEAVALEKLKETAEQSENIEEAEYIDKLISLVTHIHDHLIMLKQSQICTPIQIPPDFCCPLSLDLMTDPVIVGSGQTYERAYIKEWIDLGLTVCPKTRQNLAHTALIPNYTVKALISSWCESNNVSLTDPVRLKDLILYPRTEPPVSPKPTRSAELTLSAGPHELTRSTELTRSPGSHKSTRSAGSKGLYGGIQRDETVHPRSSSEGCLPSVVANGHALDIGRKSLSLSNSSGQWVEGRALGRLSNVHETGVLHQETKDSSNGSGEVASSKPTEPELRSHALWHRGDRFGTKIVSSSPTESESRSSIELEVRKLVEDLKSESIDTQREASAEIRLLAKHNMDNRIVIANYGAIEILVSLLCSQDLSTQENAVTALLNLSINDNNKTLIAQNAIRPLIHVLETGTPVARENSAATLFSLSVIEDNKVVIGRSGAIKPLVDLLGNGTPRGKKDAATALYNLSIFPENKARILEAGAVRYLVELMDPAAGMVDKAVAVLANLATVPEGRNKIGQEKGIPFLVEVVELGSARGKENAAAALLQLCTNSPRFCNMVLQQGAVPPLVALSQSGTPRAKEKAQSLLTLFRNQRHSNGARN